MDTVAVCIWGELSLDKCHPMGYNTSVTVASAIDAKSGGAIMTRRERGLKDDQVVSA
jgi:hypothetical protein